MSVVIPTFNRARVLRDAVESVLTQTFEDFDVIVVDDASTDDTAECVLALTDSRVRYLREPRNLGPGAARNRGVALTRGPIIAFLDSDDLWRRDKLAMDVAFLDAHPEVDAVFADLEHHEGATVTPSFMRQTSAFSRRLREPIASDGLVLGQREMLLYLLEEVPVKSPAFSVRRPAFERAGGFDEGWSSSEDWEFFLRLAEISRFGYIDRPLAVIRISTDSLHRVKQEWGQQAMLGLLVRRLSRFADDPEAVAAIRRGIRDCTRHLSWYYLERGRRLAAFTTYVRGFRDARDPGLLARAAAVFLPRPVVGAAKRAVSAGSVEP